MVKITSKTKNYFVDEAGSPDIFGDGGKVIVGTPGCSRYFILGFLDVPDKKTLRDDLRKLHKEIISDPYFIKVPSLKPESKKTYQFFHAKDDIPEVRIRVYQLIKDTKGIKFVAVVKDKLKVVQYALEKREKDPKFKYNPNELYDLLTRRIFKNHLHLAAQYNVSYAIRGDKPRTDAFGHCLSVAQSRFMIENKLENASEFILYPTQPQKEPCLQAADYYLWALQRMYEMGEERYVEFLKEKFDLIIDIDDTRNKSYGEYYDTKRNIISLEKIKRGN